MVFLGESAKVEIRCVATDMRFQTIFTYLYLGYEDINNCTKDSIFSIHFLIAEASRNLGDSRCIFSALM